MHQLRRISELLERLRTEPISAALVSLAGDSAVYLTGGVLVGLGNIILIPLYTRCLAPREFGVYALVDVTLLLVVAVSALKLDVSYLKWFAEVEPIRRGELLGTTLLAGFLTSALGGLALSFLAASRLGELWLHTSGRNFAWMLLPIVALENLQVLFLTDLRARRRSISYSAVAIVRLAAMVLASYYLLAIRQTGLSGLFFGRLIGDGAAIIFLIIVGLRSVVFRISPAFLKPMLRFGLPLLCSVFAVMLQDASGRYFLSRYGTIEQVGLLSAAIKIGSVFQVLVSVPFGVAWGGVLFQVVKERDAQVIYSKIFGYVYVLALGVALVLTILAPTLFRIFTAPAYYSAISLFPLILLVRAMNVIEQPSATGIYLAGRTYLFALVYTVGLGLNVFLLYVLVPRYGSAGVCWSWLIGSALVPILNLFFGQKCYRLSFSIKLIFIPVLLWIFVILLWPKNIASVVVNHFLAQCALCVAVTLSLVVLLLDDIRAVRQQLRNRSVGARVWEVSS